MAAEKTLAIVIRLVEYSESSYIATLFTETHGKITGLAKGARRAKSAFENALDLLAISRVLFLPKSSGAMELLTEAKLERRFRAAARDAARFYAGCYVAELLGALTDERDPHPDLFRNALQTVVALDENGDIGKEVLQFELAVLRDLGQLPAVDACVECGATIDPSRRVSFGQLAGGALCERCRPGKRFVVSLSRAAASAFSRLVDEAASPPPAASLESYLATQPTETGAELDSAVRAELRGLMTNRMSHLLGRRPRTHAFLAMLK